MKIEIIVNDEKVELPKLKEDKIKAYLFENADKATIKADEITLTGFESTKSKVDSNGNLKIKNHDLRDLRQKVINYLYNKECSQYELKDIELLYDLIQYWDSIKK